MRAHFCHGRILQELGQTSDAKAIYEEVAACDERNIEDVGESRRRAADKSPEEEPAWKTSSPTSSSIISKRCTNCHKKDYSGGSPDLADRAQGEFRKMLRLPGIDLGVCQELPGIGQSRPAKKALRSRGPQAAGRNGQDPQPLPAGRHQAPPPTQSQTRAGRSFEDAVIDGNAALEKKNWATAIEFYEKAIADQAAAAKANNPTNCAWPPSKTRSSAAITTWPHSFIRRARSMRPSPWRRGP